LTEGNVPGEDRAEERAVPLEMDDMQTWRFGWRRLGLAAALLAIAVVLLYVIYLAEPAIALWVSGCDVRPDRSVCA
jgi:hypothetical protein